MLINSQIIHFDCAVIYLVLEWKVIEFDNYYNYHTRYIGDLKTQLGHSLKNGIWVCVALKTPFSHHPPFVRPPFQNFSQFSRSFLSPLNHKFLENLSPIIIIIHWLRSRRPQSFSMQDDHQQVWQSAAPKCSKLATSSVLKPQIGLKFSSHGYILLRNSTH